jgi:acetyl-CoA decarbonylase/synthase complex subunit beta
MQIELGGPAEKEKFEIVRVRPADQITDGAITIIGPDLSSMEEGKHYPLGILVEIAGAKVEPDLEGVVERRIHEYCNYIEGFMHLNQRYDIWMRLSKKSYKKGLTSFRLVGEVMQELFRNELPIIEKIQISFITDSGAIHPLYEDAMRTYETRDARARGLSDEEVDTFYGCALCQSFAPTHVCVITPQRYANCGAISWFDGRAAAGIDPKGPIFAIDKGQCIDPERGEYTGINESAKKRSMGEVNRVYLYSAFGYPHTSCGCFEGIAFYIPEVDGFGLVLRGFRDVTVNGLAFSTMADSTAGGRQIDGFHGISIEYMRSTKFMHADGGWERVVWMPHEIKERLKDYIPSSVYQSIATEKDVGTIEELRVFLKDHRHPVTARWDAEAKPTGATGSPISVFSGGDIPITAGGFRIILKNAKITAEKVIIQPIKPASPQGGGHHDGKKQ